MRQYPSWLPEEAEYLDRQAGDVPFPELVRRMRRRAKENGWPSRSEKAILLRLRRTGHRGRARHGLWVTTGGAADLLECPRPRVEAWLRRPKVNELLEPRVIGKIRYIERKAWRRLAAAMPKVLGGFSADQLFALLEDRELAEDIAVRFPRPLGDWRVRCVETGEIFASCGAVAKRYHVTQPTISDAIRRRRAVPTLGLTFEALRRCSGSPATVAHVKPQH